MDDSAFRTRRAQMVRHLVSSLLIAACCHFRRHSLFTHNNSLIGDLNSPTIARQTIILSDVSVAWKMHGPRDRFICSDAFRQAGNELTDECALYHACTGRDVWCNYSPLGEVRSVASITMSVYVCLFVRSHISKTLKPHVQISQHCLYNLPVAVVLF